MKDVNISLGRKKAVDAPPTPQVPSTVFNFVESAAESIRKVRIVSRVVLVVGVVGLALLGYLAFSANRSAADATARSDEATIERASLNRELQELTGGATALPEHATMRRDELGSALATDTDAGELIAQVLATTPTGVLVESVDVTGVVTDETPIGSEPEREDGAAAKPVPTAEPRELRIIATAPNFDVPIEWRNALNSLGILSEIVVEPTRNGAVVNVTIVAKVNDAAAQSRRQSVATSVGPLTGSTPTPAPGGK